MLLQVSKEDFLDFLDGAFSCHALLIETFTTRWAEVGLQDTSLVKGNVRMCSLPQKYGIPAVQHERLQTRIGRATRP